MVRLSGLTCHACQKLVEKFLKRIEGVKTVIVDLDSGKTSIIANRVIAIREIEQALANTAYQIERD